jgi:predicted aldo/keto reductase-like oxidoreductase
VLSEPAVDGLVVSMTSPEMVDEYVEASGGGAPDAEDLALLARYQERNNATSCLVGCADCQDACPLGVSIPDVLRMRMYDVDYEQPRIAAAEYARLESGASPCLTCSGTPCANACPAGLAIPDLMRETERRLAPR